MRTISVIVPTYNRRPFLKECMDNILAQTCQPSEIIIVDDCSTDGSMEYIEELYGSLENVQILYIRNDSRIGLAESVNVGVSSAQGEIVAFCNGNDVWRHDKLEKQAELLDANPDGMVYCRYARKGEEDQIFPAYGLDIESIQQHIFQMALLYPMGKLSTFLLPKKCFEEAGGLNAELKYLEDYEFFIRVAGKYPVMLEENVLTVCDDTIRQDEVDQRIAAQYYIMEHYKDTLDWSGLKRKKFETAAYEAAWYGKERMLCLWIMQISADEEYRKWAKERLEEINPSSNPETVATENISGVSKCTGCLACYNKCPVQAISIRTDEEGFLSPVIDDAKCIHCGACKAVCPVCNETQGALLPEKCYAVQGSAAIRKESSSGGVFSILAEAILQEGGYVAGAVWGEDFQVMHIVSNDRQDVERMRSSKYIQSNAGKVYSAVERLLKDGKAVLFTGCSCQIVALRRYLGGGYDKLYTAEVICHGVPSQTMFDSYLENRDDVAEISFRDKKTLGWQSGISVQYKDGSSYTARAVEDPYMAGFLANWTLRESCYHCQFKNKKYSDLILGDFWGIQNISDMEDGYGTSCVIVNTQKGNELFQRVTPQFDKLIQVETEHAVRGNRCLVSSVEKPKSRQLFFDEWKKNGRRFTAALETVKAKTHFDVAVVCHWSSNYGNAMTNWALTKYLERQGKRVVLLDNFYPSKAEAQFGDFAAKQYMLSSDYFMRYDWDALNHSCDLFLVASDQTWNYSYTNTFNRWQYYCLDFVENDKRKVSYASSFGRESTAMPIAEAARLFGRFEGLSVREESGVSICRNLFGVSAQWVLDPVFLLEKKDYINLAAGAEKIVKGSYLLTYILNPTQEKINLCKAISEMLGGIRIINIIDAAPSMRERNLREMNYENIRVDLSVEDWISYFVHSDYVITDSYHGVCFSVILEKKFLAIKNRESARFDTFRLFPEITDRIIDEIERYSVEEYNKEIDYEHLRERLQREREKSEGFIWENILSYKADRKKRNNSEKGGKENIDSKSTNWIGKTNEDGSGAGEKNKTKKVSVVVPCFNAAKYLPNCMESLVHQTIGVADIEIILVDDASTDNGATWNVIKDYENRYSKTITAVSLKQNMRQGGARNVGISYAGGEYLFFCDADDWITLDALELLYCAAKEYNADEVEFCSKKVYDREEINVKSKAEGIGSHLEVIESREERKSLFYRVNDRNTLGCWNKLYRLEIVKNRNIRFAEGVIMEEPSFTLPYKAYISRYYYLNRELYYYYQSDGSTLHSGLGERKQDNAKVWLGIIEDMKKRNLFGQYHDELEALFLSWYLGLSMTIWCQQGGPITPQELLTWQTTVLKIFPNAAGNKYLNPNNGWDQVLQGVLKIRVTEESAEVVNQLVAGKSIRRE